jgi:oxygen-independent coproporphyrinogen-3 oxidase
VPTVRHLYVHVPFCAHRCGYCDFVTVTGHEAQHGSYVDALLAELAASEHLDPAGIDTVFVGGGTPTLLGPQLLGRLLDGLPAAAERTVECNPETVTPELARALADRGLRVSLGAQSFQAPLLAVLERRATPAVVEAAVSTLREAGVANLSLDLIHGIPGQDRALLDADLDRLIALQPDHCSAYELEAKPGTRFTHAHGAELARQGELLEEHYERVIERLEGAGYTWYESANFARPGHESAHNLAYWLGRDYLGIGVGAVSTLGAERRVNAPRLQAYMDAIAAGQPAPAKLEELPGDTKQRERLMLGLRLADGVERAAVDAVVDPEALALLVAHGVVVERDGRIVLERRGRLLVNDVVARLLRDDGRP